ncbi:unnamed protein product [Lactuca saligna]|uniref:Uncharacterized protein n=1 Tax=Lactuca saligna TaxID=75948 RepID=A0AA35ZV05_LACSI|nr:unnamed protein product [Lactuca saligna]
MNLDMMTVYNLLEDLTFPQFESGFVDSGLCTPISDCDDYEQQHMVLKTKSKIFRVERAFHLAAISLNGGPSIATSSSSSSSSSISGNMRVIS